MEPAPEILRDREAGFAAVTRRALRVRMPCAFIETHETVRDDASYSSFDRRSSGVWTSFCRPAAVCRSPRASQERAVHEQRADRARMQATPTRRPTAQAVGQPEARNSLHRTEAGDYGNA